MAKENSSEIIFVVDRSGSMQRIAADMQGGFQTLIQDQAKVEGECFVTLAQFDDKYEVVYEAKPIAEVPPLEIIPRGTTALLDAIGKTIETEHTRISAMPETEKPAKVIFVIITDGAENASREHTKEKVFNLISRQREAHQWEVIFLGANQDAIAVAKDLGINTSNAVNYAASSYGAKAIMNTMSLGLSNARRGINLGDMQASYNSFVDNQGSTSVTPKIDNTIITNAADQKMTTSSSGKRSV